MTPMPFFRRRLSDELARRAERNPGYSLRAFARALRTDPGALSRILSGQKVPSYKLSQRIFQTLMLSPEEQNEFLSSIVRTRQSTGIKRLSPVLKQFRNPHSERPRELSLDVFRVISDWYHYAILELTYVEGFRSDPKWIAQKLGISAVEAKLAVERLLALELLKIEDGAYVKTDFLLTTADRDMTTAAHRKRQKQVLQKAIHSLENDPIELRNQSAMTMAIDPKKVPAAKKKIDEFLQELCSFLESGDRLQVYELSASLFPLQITGKEIR